MDNQEVYSLAPENNNNNVEPGMTGKQRAGVFFLIFLIIIILGVWYLQIRQYITLNMYGSFNPVTLREEEINNQKLLQNQERLDTVYNTDTDGDTVPDWEEMNIYNTSPFLADSDGDGINDKQEIDNKTDPNCPEGKQCVGSMAIDQQPTNNATSTILPTAPNVTQDQKQILQQAFGDNPDTNFLRTQLLNATVNDQQKAAINALTDQQLIDFYKQMIQGAIPNDSPTGTLSTTINQTSNQTSQ